jgi:hypothetical protein
MMSCANGQQYMVVCWKFGCLHVQNTLFGIDQELAYDLCLEVGAAWVLCAASSAMMTKFGRLLV